VLNCFNDDMSLMQKAVQARACIYDKCGSECF
jgi:hypothetical protein